MDQFQGITYPYVNPYDNSFSQRVRQMAATSPMPASMQGWGLAIVPTINDVERVQMTPGERKVVLIQNSPNIHAIRAADAAGFVATEYRESKVIDPKSLAPEQPQQQYASIQEVNDLKTEIAKLKSMLEGVNAKSTSKSAAGA